MSPGRSRHGFISGLPDNPSQQTPVPRKRPRYLLRDPEEEEEEEEQEKEEDVPPPLLK